MSTPHDEDDLHVRASGDLASLALGEPTEPVVADHIEHCPLCQAELADYERVAALARLTGRQDDVDLPSEDVWQRIQETIDPPAPPVVATAPPRRWRRTLVAVAAAVAVFGAAVGGWAVGHSSSPNPPDRSAQAVLQAQPGTKDEAHGTASMHTSSTGYSMDVKTNGLPAYSGYYEVWLYNPDSKKMIAIGTLGAGGAGSFTVPGGIDTQAFHVVDVSAQRINGDNRHQRSVLQGALIR